jgi:hypothetical protein
MFPVPFSTVKWIEKFICNRLWAMKMSQEQIMCYYCYEACTDLSNPLHWHQTIHPFLLGIGFRALDADPCIYFKGSAAENNLQLISLHVDNLGIAADQQSDVDFVRSKLQAENRMTDEPEDLFLGMELKRTSSGGFTLCQSHAIDALIIDTNCVSAYPVSNSMKTLTISTADCPEHNSRMA